MKEQSQDYSTPKLYRDPASMLLTNQTNYRKNYLAEILAQQEVTNQTLTASVAKVKNKLKKNRKQQGQHYTHIMEKLENQEKFSEDIKTEVKQNDLSSKDVVERLAKLESMSEEVGKVLEEERIMSQATIDQLSYQEDISVKIHKKLEDYENLYHNIQEKMQEQEHFYQQINEKLQIQDMFHQSVIDQMEKQDIKSQQMAKQMDSLRDTLVEKVDSAVTSIESIYMKTIQFFGGFFRPTDQSIRKKSKQKEQKLLEK